MFIWKPWYVYRPKQMFLRAWRSLLRVPPNTVRRIELPWGDHIKADVTKTIGASIWMIGIYEITVSEVLSRLIRPGDLVIDAGANIGYMSLLMGRCTGSEGRLFSFEPHPALFQLLRENIDEARRRTGFAQTTLCNAALSSTQGEALLTMPKLFDENEGIAHLVDEKAGEDNRPNCIRVPTETIDNALAGRTASVLKLDVEGHEAAVLRGATTALRERRIRHVIYEDFQGPDSETASLLRGYGYTVLFVGARISGPLLADKGEDVQELYEPPSFLATCEPEWAYSRCADRGWTVLRSRLQNQR